MVDELRSMIRDTAKAYDVDPDLIESIVSVESGFNPDAVSKAGAQGLMQIMPDTGKDLGLEDPFNSKENVEAGTKHFARLLKKYGGDEELASAAYNAGEGNVEKYGGIPPFPETQNYVKKVQTKKEQLKKRESVTEEKAVEAINKFRENIKNKYNDPTLYDNKSDLEIAEALAKKYPDSALYQALPEKIANAPKIAEEETYVEQQKSLLDRGMDEMLETSANIGRVYPAIEVALNMASSYYGVPLSGAAALFALPQGTDKAKKVFNKAMEYLVYEPVTEKGQELLETMNYPARLYQKGTALAGRVTTDLTGSEKAGKVVETGLNVAPIVAGARNMLKPTVSKAVTLSKDISKAVKRGVNKAQIIPQKTGISRKTMDKYYKDSESAVESIIKNKDNLKLTDLDGNPVNGAPKTLDQFSQAIDQTQSWLLKQYDDILRKTKATVDVKPIINELKPLLKNVALEDWHPSTLRHIRDRIGLLERRGTYTVAEAHDTVQFLKQLVKEYKSSGVPEPAGLAMVDSLVKNKLRELLNNKMDSLTGPDYVGLKQEWGRLKTLRTDVNKAALRNAKKTNKTFMDITDIYTSSHLISGLARLAKGTGGSEALGGLSGFLLKEYYQHINNPNTVVKTMFKDVEKYMQRRITPPVPKVAKTTAMLQAEQVPQIVRRYEDGEMDDRQRAAFEELVRRGKIKYDKLGEVTKHKPKGDSKYTEKHKTLRDKIQKVFGVGRQ